MNGTAASTGEAVKVLLVGDDPLARGGLMALLQGQPGLEVVGQANAEEVTSAVQAFHPDTAAWDLGLEPKALLPKLRAVSAEDVPVAALLPDDRAAAEVLGAGARGVLMRDADRRRLGAALLAVGRGSYVIDESLAGALLPARPAATGAASDVPAEALTARELEVLQLLAQGLPNKSIAQRLSISDHTAKFHVNAILAKLGVQSRTEAVVKAARLGMVIL